MFRLSISRLTKAHEFIIAVYRGLAGAAASPNRPRPANGRVSNHRRHQRRDVRVCHGFRSNVGRLQLEAQLPVVSSAGKRDDEEEQRPNRTVADANNGLS